MQTEVELFRAIAENLYTAVLGDVLDVLGYTHQFLPQPVQPMKESMRVVGRAMPVQIADTWSKQEDPFGLMTAALDQLLPGEVYVSYGRLSELCRLGRDPYGDRSHTRSRGCGD